MTEINGTDDVNDTLYGTKHNDLIDGKTGNDKINSSFGIDKVHGGEGDDIIYTFDGGDTIFPGTWATGNDKIYIGDTTKNGATTVDGTEFWADTVENVGLFDQKMPSLPCCWDSWPGWTGTRWTADG